MTTEKQRKSRYRNWMKAQLKCSLGIIFQLTCHTDKVDNKDKRLLNKADKALKKILETWDKKTRENKSC